LFNGVPEPMLVRLRVRTITFLNSASFFAIFLGLARAPLAARDSV
jgi:hypothetical protein